MKLPRPGVVYDAHDEAQMRAAIERADAASLKAGETIELSAGAALIVASPDGTRWRLGVSDGGATVWTMV